MGAIIEVGIFATPKYKWGEGLKVLPLKTRIIPIFEKRQELALIVNAGFGNYATSIQETPMENVADCTEKKLNAEQVKFHDENAVKNIALLNKMGVEVVIFSLDHIQPATVTNSYIKYARLSPKGNIVPLRISHI